MNKDFDSLDNYVQKVGCDANYWMIRTMGGDYYDDFVDKGYIAIGYNEVSLDEILNLPENAKMAIRQLKGFIQEHHQNIERSGYVSAQLYKFCREIKVGDIIVLPGRSSYRTSICRVTGNIREVDIADNESCRFKKRIPIVVLERTSRRLLPPKAQLMFNSRHPVSDISLYAHCIDSAIHDFYDKGEELHLVLNVKTVEAVTSGHFYSMHRFIAIALDYCNENGVAVSENDIELKIQMESPGFIHYISENKKLISVISALILLINGGGLKTKFGDFEFDLSTPGLIKSCSDYLDRSTDRETRESMKNALDSLEIETPEDFQKAVIEMYRTQNDAREKY